MTPSALCIARSSLDRTLGSELAHACLYARCCALSIVRSALLWLVLTRRQVGNRYFLLRERWRAAQLAAEADKPPNAAAAGRAGSCCARRTASRRLQTLNVKHLVHRGKRRAARPLACECGLQLNV